MVNDTAEEQVNQKMRILWERLWSLEGGAAAFSIHGEILERAKWQYLTEDLNGMTSGLALDVGCGSGTLGAMPARVGVQVVLLDYSDVALRLAQQSFNLLPGRERKSFVQGNAFSLPLADDSEMVERCGFARARIFTAGVMPPRDMPFSTGFKTVNRFQSFVLGKLEWLWVALDGTVIADWLGADYYVTATKPLVKCGQAGA